MAFDAVAIGISDGLPKNRRFDVAATRSPDVQAWRTRWVRSRWFLSYFDDDLFDPLIQPSALDLQSMGRTVGAFRHVVRFSQRSALLYRFYPGNRSSD